MALAADEVDSGDVVCICLPTQARHHHAQVGGKIDCQLPTSWAEKTGWFGGGFIEEVVGGELLGETEEVSADRLLPTHFSANNNCLVSFPWESGLVAREANRD